MYLYTILGTRVLHLSKIYCVHVIASIQKIAITTTFATGTSLLCLLQQLIVFRVAILFPTIVWVLFCMDQCHYQRGILPTNGSVCPYWPRPPCSNQHESRSTRITVVRAIVIDLCLQQSIQHATPMQENF